MRVYPPCDLFYDQGLVRQDKGIELPDHVARQLLSQGWTAETAKDEDMDTVQPDLFDEVNDDSC